MPSVYSMDYAGTGPVSEKILIENGRRLYQEIVCKKHKMRPHVFAVSLGCAVTIGVADKIGPQCFESVTLVDPFTNFADEAAFFVKRQMDQLSGLIPSLKAQIQ